MSIFRVEKRSDCEGGLLGYDWVEVLAIQQMALGHPGREYGDWCDRVISSDYICLTEHGLTRIGAEDFWAAIEDYGEYDEQSPQANYGGIVITTGDQSVVQTGGGTIRGGVSTSRDSIKTSGGGVGQGTGATMSIDARLVDLGELVEELARLRGAMLADAEAPADYVAIGAIAEAEEAATSGDEERVRGSLARAGQKALDLARKIGVEIAVRAIAGSIVQ